MSGSREFANGGPVSLHVAPAGTPAPTSVSAGYALPSALVSDLAAVHGFLHSDYVDRGLAALHVCTMARLVNGATECTRCGRRGL